MIKQLVLSIKAALLIKDSSKLTNESRELINNELLHYLKKRDLNKEEVETLRCILELANLIYVNAADIYLMDDGIYDMAIELYRSYNPNIPIGSKDIVFDSVVDSSNDIDLRKPFIYVEKAKEMLYYNNIMRSNNRNYNELSKPFKVSNESQVFESLSKRIVGEVNHDYPELAGTLSKCKVVLECDVANEDILDDPTVKIFERDFIGRHIIEGVINPNHIEAVVMLKLDGISVIGDVSNMIYSAVTRGDTENSIAADLTPILYGYPFPGALQKNISDNDRFGMKFEAIMTYENLNKFNERRADKATPYKNARTAIIGLFGSSNAQEYFDLITLVPLATSMNMDKDVEIEFMNKYYSNEYFLPYIKVSGDVTQVLYQVKKFVDEAEYMRPYMPYMYDGVVFCYNDEKVIKKLGRKNSIDQFATAIKFNPLKRQTIFRKYTFTVGQDGSITPMIHYDPVEFYGTIHPKSTGHSYNRFKELNLRPGDIIDVEYVNDVMPYVTKPYNSHNEENTNPVFKFIERCPECGNKLIESDSGKTMSCTNMHCSGRAIARMVNMLSKLNVKDFAEANLKEISAYSFKSFIESMDRSKDINLGTLTMAKLENVIHNLLTTPIEDYKLIGSLGFTNIGRRNWSLILNTISLEDIITLPDNQLFFNLTSIKGIGQAKANTIIAERIFFMEDLMYIHSMTNVISTLNAGKKIKVRFTGVRNKDLVDRLNSTGIYDADGDAGVTKDTKILIVPYDGFTSSKTSKVSKECEIVSIETMLKTIDLLKK